MRNFAATVVLTMLIVMIQLTIFFIIEIDKRKNCARIGGEYIRTPFTKDNICKKDNKEIKV